MKLTNKLNKKNNVDISYWINPTFGNFEEKTAKLLNLGIDKQKLIKMIESAEKSDMGEKND